LPPLTEQKRIVTKADQRLPSPREGTMAGGLSDERLKRESLRFRWLEDRENRSPHLNFQPPLAWQTRLSTQHSVLD